MGVVRALGGDGTHECPRLPALEKDGESMSSTHFLTNYAAFLKKSKSMSYTTSEMRKKMHHY